MTTMRQRILCILDPAFDIPMKRYLLLSCLFFMSLAVHAQPEAKKTDSLKRALQGNIPDTVRLECYAALANLYAPTDSATAFSYMQQAIDHAMKNNMHRHVAKGYNDMGFLFEQYGNVKQAINYYYNCVRYGIAHDNPRWAAIAYGNLYFVYKSVDYPKSLAILDTGLIYAEKADHRKLMGNMHNNRGSQLTFLGRYEESMADLTIAAKIYQEINEIGLLSNTYANIGNNYNLMKQYDVAIRYLKMAMDIAAKNPAIDPSNALINLSSSYYQKAMYDSSIYYSQLCVAEYERTSRNKPGYGSALGNIGLCYKELNDYPRALSYLQQSLDINNKTDPFNYATTLTSVALMHAEMKQYNKAVQALDEAYNMVAGHNMTVMMMNVLQNKAEVYYRMGRSAEAYKLLERSFNLKDSIYNKDVTDKVSELETKYRTAQKENQIEALNRQTQIQQLTLSRQRIWIFAIASIAVLVLASVYLLQRSRRLRKEAAHQQHLKARQEQATRDMIEAELNERRRIASELHDGVGQTFSAVRMNLSGINEQVHFNDAKHRAVYSKSMAMIDEGCQELRTISHMMMPEMLLKKGFEAAMHELVNRIDQERVSVSLSISDFPKGIGQHTEMTLYRISQEIINNALKHANASNIDIQVSAGAGNIFLTIEDDGIGFDITKTVINGGLGLGNIRSRVALLKGSVEIDSRPGAGTVVTVTLPISNNNERSA